MNDEISRTKLAAIFRDEAEFWAGVPTAATPGSFAYMAVAQLHRLANALEEQP